MVWFKMKILKKRATSNGQSPFVTLFMNVHESDGADYALIVKVLLEQRLKGMENGKGVFITPAFPKLVYVLNSENTKGQPLYWLTQLAATCTAKRLYPKTDIRIGV